MKQTVESRTGAGWRTPKDGARRNEHLTCAAAAQTAGPGQAPDRLASEVANFKPPCVSREGRAVLTIDDDLVPLGQQPLQQALASLSGELLSFAVHQKDLHERVRQRDEDNLRRDGRSLARTEAAQVPKAFHLAMAFFVMRPIRIEAAYPPYGGQFLIGACQVPFVEGPIAAVVALDKLGLPCTQLNERDVKTTKLKECSVLIMPGGRTAQMVDALEKEGLERIRQFVLDGGGYIGICTGAYPIRKEAWKDAPTRPGSKRWDCSGTPLRSLPGRSHSQTPHGIPDSIFLRRHLDRSQLL